ncbi:MAG TPA: hypothetical protein VFH00_02810 [Candidatus Nitrosotalea sp.]|nr:hypothetical protein [Candidatus Nitrosotalea sp.]
MVSTDWAPPAFLVGVGMLLIAVCCVVVALIWGDCFAAVEYQWGLAGNREAPAQVVNTITTYHRRGGTTRQVVLKADGSTQTIQVHDGELFGKLARGTPVRELLVTDRVVAIRMGAQELPIEDNLQWLVGMLAGIVLGVAVLIGGIRAGHANGFFTRGAIASYQSTSKGRPEGIVFVGSAVLFLSAFSIVLIEFVTGGVPSLPVVASVISAVGIGGGTLAIRMARMVGTLDERASLSRSGQLITALIVRAKNGQWDVSFIGNGPVPKDLTLGTLDEAALNTIANLIAHTNNSRPVDVSFAWYPWESKSGRGPHGEFMIFTAQHQQDEYVATLDGRPEVTASSPTFEDLSTAIETVMTGQGDADPQHLQACITWNRTLTNFGYVHSGIPS